MGEIGQRERWTVQKYGGTSVGKLLDTITGTIIPKYLLTGRVAVICSARSSLSKSKGTTSLLLEAIDCATSSETSTKDLDSIIDAIKDDHLDAVRNAVGDKIARLQGVIEDIENDCEKLRSFLKATWTVGEISDRTQDRVLAVGEKLSCRIVSASLNSKGIPAEVVLLDDVVQSAHKRHTRDQRAVFSRNPVSFLRDLSGDIEARILRCGNKVPVITGFFGAMPDSLVSSVGRGYSDLCGALCATSLSASELQIWKEVDGIFTADPRKVASARLLATVTSEEASELTHYGSEVIHPMTMDVIKASQISLRIKNVMNPEGTGTIIYPTTESPEQSPLNSYPPTPGLSPSASPSPPADDARTPRSIFMRTHGYHGEGQERRVPTALTVKDSVSVITVKSFRSARPHLFLDQISSSLRHHDLSVDLISSSMNSLSLAVSTANPSQQLSIEEAVADLEQIGTTSVSRNLSIVSVVGHKMRNMVGVAAEIFTALASAKINIYLISQGSNEINISFVVKAQDALLAMEVVHKNVMRIPSHFEQESNFSKGPWLY